MEWQITECAFLITDFRSYGLQGPYIKRMEKRNSILETQFTTGDWFAESSRLLRGVPRQAQFRRDPSHGLNHISHMFP